MKRRARKILLYFTVALVTVASLQLVFSTKFFSSWNNPSTFNSNTLHGELEIEKQLKTETQGPTAESQHFTTHSTPQFLKHKTSLITNRSCAEQYDLLILVSSAPANLNRRNNIRKTWAFERAFKPRWTTAFLVAQARDKTLSNSLLKEDKVYGDLVRANYYDHYWNQTRKIQMGFEWAIRYCKFSFLLKLDDDVFVNIPKVLSFLHEPTTPKEKLYAGNHYTNQTPFRGGKWMVTVEEYNETRYPDFCPGFGYILSHDVVNSFVETFSSLPFFRLDDVYVGMLASRNRIKIKHNVGFEVWHPPGWKCIPKPSTLVRHDVGEDCQLKMFKRAGLTSLSAEEDLDTK